MTYYINEGTRVGANEERLIIEVWTTPDINAIAYDTTSVRLDIRYTAHQNKFSGDNQTLKRTGSWTGDTNFYMPSSNNATVVIANDVRYVTPQQNNKVGVTVAGNITGHYGGANPSASLYFEINQKPDPISQVSLSSTSFVMDTTVTIYSNRINSSFTHSADIQFGNWNYSIGNIGVSDTYNFLAVNLGPQIPNATSGSGTVTLKTFNGSTYIGQSTVAFNASVPAASLPNVTGITDVDTVSAVVSNVGAYVKGLSKLRLQLTGCSGVVGSTISKQEVIVGDLVGNVTNGNATSTQWTMPTELQSSGSVQLKGRVTDSRGRIKEFTKNVTVLNYVSPNITEFSMFRCNSSGISDPVGTYARVTSKGVTTSLVNGTEKNTLIYNIAYRVKGSGGSWTTAKSNTTIAGLNLNTTETLGGGALSIANGYEFRLTISDKFQTTISYTILGTGSVTLSLNKTGIGVGKVWERGTIDAAGNIYGNHFPIEPTIPSTGSDLNNYLTSGIYVQPLNTGATNGSNYPVNIAGYLEVIGRDISPTNHTLQRYTRYDTEVVYSRRLYNSSWSPWTIIVNPQMPIMSYGVLLKTTGFQNLSSDYTWYDINLNHETPFMMNNTNQAELASNSNSGGSLRALVAGVYKISAEIYVSGGATGSWVKAVIAKWVSSTPTPIASATTEKTTSLDQIIHMSCIQSLSANQDISLRAMRVGGDSSTSLYGDPSRGTEVSFLEMFRIG